MKNTFRLLNGNIFYLMLIALVVFFSSCMKNSNDDFPTQPTSGLMAANLAPNQNTIGFRLGSSIVSSNGLQYTNYTGSYLPVTSGARTIEAFNINNNATLASSPANFEVGKYYSAFLVGNDNTYSTVFVEDELDSLQADPGIAYVRVINAIIDSSKPIFTIKVGDQTPVNVPIGYKTITSFYPINVGSIDVSIKNDQGSINVERSFPIEERKVYTIMLVGNPSIVDPACAVQIKYIQNGTIR